MPMLALIHTVATLPAVFQPLVRQALPGWSSFNILDESLLQHTIRDGARSNRTKQRLAQYVFSAADAGADAIVVTCSTLGNAVDSIASITSVPLFRIDQGMANEAVRKAQRIGVLATLPSTLEPTGTMIRNAARPPTGIALLWRNSVTARSADSLPEIRRPMTQWSSTVSQRWLCRPN